MEKLTFRAFFGVDIEKSLNEFFLCRISFKWPISNPSSQVIVSVSSDNFATLVLVWEGTNVQKCGCSEQHRKLMPVPVLTCLQARRWWTTTVTTSVLSGIEFLVPVHPSNRDVVNRVAHHRCRIAFHVLFRFPCHTIDTESRSNSGRRNYCRREVCIVIFGRYRLTMSKERKGSGEEEHLT